MKNANFTMLDDKVPVYSTTDSTSEVITELNAGEEIILKKNVKIDDKVWVSIILSDGKKGYIAANHNGIKIRYVTLAQEHAEVFEAPYDSAKVIRMYYSDEKFKIISTVKQDDNVWIKTQSYPKEIGFIKGGTLIKEIKPPSQIWPKRIGYIGAAVAVLLVNILSPSHETNPVIAAKNGFQIGAIAGAGGGFAANLIAHLFFRIFR